MDSHSFEQSEEPLAETPEDVAILYSWANLHGAKYRDFSASRREYRAQVRHRAAEELRQAELAAEAHAESAAAAAEQVAREAERAAMSVDNYDSGSQRETALRTAEAAARRAGTERLEAARRAEAAAVAEAIARREEREIAEAHASAERQARSYSTSEIRRRYLAGPQPTPLQPGQASDPYGYVHGSAPPVEHHIAPPAMPKQSDYAAQIRYSDEYASHFVSGERRAFRPELEVRRRPQGYRPDEASQVRPAYRPATNAAQTIGKRETDRHPPPPLQTPEQPGPAWLYAASPPSQPPGVDTLQQNRERVASRWFALKDAFEPGQEPPTEVAPEPQKDAQTPVLAVFSLAGGVGKTSLVATLGRALSSLGEKVLLADTTSHGLLPYYFGASELKPGSVRTFSPPSGSTDAPIHLVSYDVEKTGGDSVRQSALIEELAKSAGAGHRLLLDLNASSGWMIRRLAGRNPTILVPVAPDMNSVISLQTVERYFEGLVGQDGRATLPYYVLIQFDSALPLHLDVREVLRRQLGDRLLPIVVRRAPAVSEALAEGMTVVDYAPEAAVTEDYRNIATWLRHQAAPAMQGSRDRWSER